MWNIILTILIAGTTFALAAFGVHYTSVPNSVRKFIWIIALLGVSLVAVQAVLSKGLEREIAKLLYELAALNNKVESVKTQNDAFIAMLSGLRNSSTTGVSSSSTSNPPDTKDVSTNSPEVKRRQAMLQALRNEYILSHDGISTALLAGLEWPPSEWINRRLKELGEKWRVKTTSDVQRVDIVSNSDTRDTVEAVKTQSQPPGQTDMNSNSFADRSAPVRQAEVKGATPLASPSVPLQQAQPTNPPGTFVTASYRLTAISARKDGNHLDFTLTAESLADKPIQLVFNALSCYLLDEGGNRWNQQGFDSAGLASWGGTELEPGTKVRSTFSFIAKDSDSGTQYTLICPENSPQMGRRVMIRGIATR
jgi:hypothetical protein